MPFTEDPWIEKLERALIHLHYGQTAVAEAGHLAEVGAPSQWINRETRYAQADLATVKELLIELRWSEETYSAGQVAAKKKTRRRAR